MRLALLLVAAALMPGCSAPAPACPTLGTGDVQTIIIHVGSNADGSMYFYPGTITVAHCSKVQFAVTNDDSIFHDVALLNYGGHSYEHELGAGETKTTYNGGLGYFVADTVGSFPVICEVQGHAAKGMRATFVVQ
ncbi:MAG: hypothetical protein ACYDBQ_05450 [Thermoplasmatota archaeon]